MASPSLEYLNNVWQYVPQGHEKPLKQAFYNTIANIFVLLAAAAVVAVYFVFSPFLRPLCWAVLCGTFLYPFKRTLTDGLRGWLKGLSSSGTPFFLGLVILPVQVVASTSDTLSDVIRHNFAVILAVLAGLISLQLFYHFGPLYKLAQALLAVLNFVYDFLDYFSTLWVWTLVIAYVLVVCVYWRPESRRTLQIMAVPVWLIVVLHIAAAAGPLRVFLLIAMVTLMVFGFFTEVKQSKKDNSGEGDTEAENAAESADESSSSFSLLSWLKGSVLSGSKAKDTEGEGEGKEQLASGKEGSGSVRLETGPVLTPAKAATSLLDTTTAPASSKPTSLKVSQPATQGESTPATKPEKTSFTWQCFQVLLWAHILVRLWMHVWLIIILLLLPLAHMGLKLLGGTRLVGEAWTRLRGGVGGWLKARQDALAPRSVRGIGKLLMRGDRKLISVLASSLDSATSTLMILALLVGTCIFTVIAFVQVQRESMHIVTVTSNLFNNTVNPEISQWIPDGHAVQDTMDSMVDKAYVYGRGFIATKVRELLGGNEGTNITHVELQVLEVWDQVYDKLFSKNTTTKAPSPALPEVGDVWALWDMVSNRKILNISGLVAFAQDNVGTLLSVLESMWAIIRGNMSLLLTIFTSTLSIVFGGGTAILNFVVSAAIFLTTLFYLLAFSGQQYKPVEFFSSLTPASGAGGGGGATSGRFGQAVEEAISGVFMASLKMSAFYGLYTWLVHLVFGLDIVFIPSALAAMFAAIPFVGAYWACLPGVVDLWLVQGKGLAAAACFVAHMVPSYIVDTAIYSEIKEGHPFLTGLAIAGGMYCMGLEGAILGPILLCCLIVLITMYGNILRSETPTTGQ